MYISYLTTSLTLTMMACLSPLFTLRGISCMPGTVLHALNIYSLI